MIEQELTIALKASQEQNKNATKERNDLTKRIASLMVEVDRNRNVSNSIHVYIL